MERFLGITFHSTALFCTTYALYHVIKFMNVTPFVTNQTGSYFQFLTIQGNILAAVTLLACLLSDVYPYGLVVRARRMLIMLTLPLSATISLIYWALILLMPRMIVPPAPTLNTPKEPSSFDPNVPMGYLPLPLDIALHLLPLLAFMIHFMLFEQKFHHRDATKTAPALACAFGLYYAAFAEYCAVYNGSFSYPFLNVPFQYRIFVYLGAVGIAFGSFTWLNSIHEGKPMMPSVYY